jgi:D-alanine-D-alanine ligase
MNIAVLAGGTSTERDVSLVTSRLVCQSLRRNGHKANIIDVFLGTSEYDSAQDFFNDDNDLDSLTKQLAKETKNIPDIEQARQEAGESFFGSSVLEYCKAADIVFIGLHGANGEDGKIQAVFDLMNIKYTGTGYLSSAISMDKQYTKKVFTTEGIPTPKGITLKKGHRLEYVPFPCVVKPCCGGSSVGVSIVNDEKEFQKAVDMAFALEDSILVEEYISGGEFTCAVLDGKALPVVQIEPLEGFYDYKNKYNGNTKETCPANISAELTEKMQYWAQRACEAAGVTTYARVDELMNEDGEIYCLEINTLPGMTPTSLLPQEAAAAGMSYDELTEKIIQISLAKYE